jgi:hypothetical protein
MIWIILISVIAATLLWIMLGPVIIFLDTQDNCYNLNLPGIFRAAVVPSGELFHIRGWVFFIPFRFDPFRSKKRRRKKIAWESGKSRPKKRSMTLSWGIKMGRDVMHSFRIRRMRLNIDTDDFMLNVQLVPVFSAINSQNIRMQVNFEGNASLLLDLRTRLGALLWAFTRNKYKSMFN